MNLFEEQIERLGIYFTFFNIYEEFGLTFKEYLEKYSKNPSECNIKQLKKEKAATTAIATA